MDFDKRKEIIARIKELSTTTNSQETFEYILTLQSQEFAKYFEQTWMSNSIKDLWNWQKIPSPFQTNNNIEREFKSLKTAIRKNIPVNDMIEELFAYSRAKEENTKSKKVIYFIFIVYIFY